MDELLFWSVGKIAESIRCRKVSPPEVLEEHLRQVDRLNPQLNAVIDINRDRLLATARRAEADAIRGKPLGVLHGVPVTIKSSVDVAGLRCEAGTRLRQGNIPANDAPLVARLRAAGALILGTTNTPEMLMAYETDNLLYGRTNNPWALDRTPGGSSGGEAAAIAAGCSAAGVGSDGGGSVRVPAHFTGICALKPTPGRIPASGHYPASLGPFARLGVVGPMARTVSDLRLLFRAMADPDDEDVSSVPLEFRPIQDAELRRIRIGYVEGDLKDVGSPEVRVALEKAARVLADRGFSVKPVHLRGLEEAQDLWWFFFVRVGAAVLGDLVAGREEELSPLLHKYLDAAAAEPPLSAQQLLNAWIQRDLCRIQLLRQMRDFPVLLCPVCSIPAFPHGQGQWITESAGGCYRDVMRFSQRFNLTGNPAVAIPAGKTEDGLPIGVQLVGRPYEEEILLGIAETLEEALQYRQRPPIVDAFA